MSSVLTIEYADDLLFSLDVSEKTFSDESKFLIAAKLYEMGKLPSGQAAANLVGKSRVEFLLSPSLLNAPTSNLREEDLREEIEFAFND